MWSESLRCLNVIWPQSLLCVCVCSFPDKGHIVLLVSTYLHLCVKYVVYGYVNMKIVALSFENDTIFVFIIQYIERVVFWCHKKTNKIDVFSAELNSQSQQSFCFLSWRQRVTVKGAHRVTIYGDKFELNFVLRRDVVTLMRYCDLFYNGSHPEM